MRHLFKASISWKKSSFWCVILILSYTLLTFWRLGSLQTPTTFWKLGRQDEPIVLDLGEVENLGSILYYLGNDEKREFLLEISDDLDCGWIELTSMTMERVYHWGRISFSRSGRFLRLTLKGQQASVGELVIKNREGQVLQPLNASEYQTLFDEQETSPNQFSWQLGTVFDECYFGRTAYEFLQGLPAYEDTHPPLGKILISVGIAGFGMNPFGWRVSSAVAGILLLPLIWRFARRVLKDEWLSVAVLALVTFDFMHFTESRLGQVDSFLVLFMTGMYYFMFRYYEAIGMYGTNCGLVSWFGNQIPENQTGWNFLLASGICMGCAISCKWSGCYGAVGLAVIWLAIIWHGLQKSYITKSYVWKTTLACVLFFVVVPIVIYLLSYIPFRNNDPTMGYLEMVVQNQKNILAFHSSQSSFHKQGSVWYQWPIILKPIRLWAAWYPDQTGEFLILMGNPAFWWPGIILLFSCIADFLEKRSGTMACLLVGYFAPIIPWMGIERSSFLYHYYPSIPFLALLMGIWAKGNGKQGRQVLAACTALSAILFVIYFPVISGAVVHQEYVEHFLQWLPTWEFTKR